MIAILIVLTYIGGLHTDGATVEMQEFSKIQACQKAKNELIANAND